MTTATLRFHAAFLTGLIAGIVDLRAGALSHTIVHLYGKAGGNDHVKQYKYGKKRLFHAVKITTYSCPQSEIADSSSSTKPSAYAKLFYYALHRWFSI